jgi:hypothetical protein
MLEGRIKPVDVDAWEDGLSTEVLGIHISRTREYLEQHRALEPLIYTSLLLEPPTRKLLQPDNHEYSNSFLNGTVSGIGLGLYLINDTQTRDQLNLTTNHLSLTPNSPENDTPTRQEIEDYRKLVFGVSSQTIEDVEGLTKLMEGQFIRTLEPNDEFRGIARAGVGFGVYIVLSQLEKVEPKTLSEVEEQFEGIDWDKALQELNEE